MSVSPSESRRLARQSTWKLETAVTFEEAEAQTRAYWRKATPAERLNGLEALRQQLYGPDQSSRRLQRFLELVPLP